MLLKLTKDPGLLTLMRPPITGIRRNSYPVPNAPVSVRLTLPPVILSRPEAELKKGGFKTIKSVPAKTGSKPFTASKRLYYGAAYLLETFADDIGLTNDLKICFPDIYKKLLSVAFFSCVLPDTRG